MRNMQSRMRGYLALGIFAMVMTVIMAFAQMDINKIKNSNTHQYSQSSNTVVFKNMVEIKAPVELRLLTL